MTRLFSHSQKRHLYISADGRCKRCGLPLGKRWHAHHEVRFTDGGVTEITNAAALCERCHIKEHSHDIQTTRLAD
jgi:5-methylcytosine-specific restriction endonuclease McrA